MSPTMELQAELDRLEELRCQLNRLRADKNDVFKQIEAAQSEYDKLKVAVERFNESGKTPPQISDHAVLRYLERVHGLNSTQVRETMMTPELDRTIRFAKSGRYKSDGLIYVFENYSVVTVYKE